MKRYSVIRTHTSPYQVSGFKDLEKNRLEKLPLDYLHSVEEIKADSELIVVTNTHTKFEDLPAEIREKARLIVHPNSGYENFASSFSALKNLPVVIGHEIRAQAVAEYTLSCFVDYWTQRPHHLNWDKSRLYPRKLMNKTSALIIGHGHIGKLLKTMLTSLGVHVKTVDPRLPADYKELSEVEESFETIILAASLNSKSTHLINQDSLQKLAPSLLINPSRGGFINEVDLMNYLDHSSMTAYLDVFEKEPLPNGSLNHERLIKTSHIAGVHRDLDQDIIEFEYQVISDFLNLSEKDFMVKYNHQLVANKWFQGELW
ncbi:MAG: NAD(P)-dependent oxidoreductase [Bacteriovoracaceae bacterium]